MLRFTDRKNTDTAKRLREIINALASLEQTTYIPSHPRLVARCSQFNIALNTGNLSPINPLTYRELVASVMQSQHVITDSGGLQRNISPWDTMHDSKTRDRVARNAIRRLEHTHRACRYPTISKPNRAKSRTKISLRNRECIKFDYRIIINGIIFTATEFLLFRIGKTPEPRPGLGDQKSQFFQSGQ